MKDEYFHYSNLSWIVINTLMIADTGFLVLIVEKHIKDILLKVFGFGMVVFLVYFAASFRLLKHHALKEAFEFGELRKPTYHLSQWTPHLIIFWVLGILWLNTLFDAKEVSRFWVLLVILWSLYVAYVGYKFENIFKI